MFVKAALENKLLKLLNGRLFHFYLSWTCFRSMQKWVQSSI